MQFIPFKRQCVSHFGMRREYNIKNGTADTQVACTCQKVMPSAVCKQLHIKEKKKVGRETDRLH